MEEEDRAEAQLPHDLAALPGETEDIEVGRLHTGERDSRRDLHISLGIRGTLLP